jgi:hypothetical protein
MGMRGLGAYPLYRLSRLRSRVQRTPYETDS